MRLLTNDTIHIERVQNGFIAYRQYGGDNDSNTWAFESLDSLLQFLVEYFNRFVIVEEKDEKS
jgi:hypothetical protein